jgi:hypothetical protein
LIHGHAPSVEWVALFERYLLEALPDVHSVRLDELVRQQWEAWVGLPWEGVPDPVDSLVAWLPSQEFGPEYFRFIPTEQWHF